MLLRHGTTHASQLDAIETGLKSLTNKEYETFLIGEETEKQALIVTPELTYANEFLNLFFNDFIED